MAYVKPELIIVRYGEIGLKQNITRRIFENSLVKNIKKSLEKQGIELEIERKRARIYVLSDQMEECSKVLKKIFGITSFSPAFKTKTSKKELKQLALNIIKNKITEKTSFALKVNRTGNHDFTSQDIAVFLGKVIQEETKAPVNLSYPDITLFVEIIENESFLFFEKTPSGGGLPLGTQGRVLSYIDSEQSILASWYLMRRGCMPVFFIKDEALQNKAESFSKNWYCSFICEKTEEDFDEIAKERKCDAMVTGFTIKDLEKIKLFKNKVKTPTLHPLIGLEESEINNKKRYIGL